MNIKDSKLYFSVGNSYYAPYLPRKTTCLSLQEGHCIEVCSFLRLHHSVQNFFGFIQIFSGTCHPPPRHNLHLPPQNYPIHYFFHLDYISKILIFQDLHFFATWSSFQDHVIPRAAQMENAISMKTIENDDDINASNIFDEVI